MTGIAVVGCGLIGRKRALAVPGGARVVGVADVDVQQAAALAADLEGDVEVMEPSELFARGDVDLVIVATPHRSLAPVACDALDAGKHVLVEKPAAADLTGVVAIEQHALAADRVALVGFNHRFHPSFLAARQIVADREFGTVMHIRARYGHGGRVGYEREWRAARAVSGGGELIDQGIHLIDLTRFIVGDVTLAFAELRTSFWDMDVEDNAFLALRGEGDALAWLHASWTEWKNLFSFEIFLERAKIDIRGLGGSYGPETLTVYDEPPELGPPGETTQVWDDADGSWGAELSACIGAIEGRSSLAATIADGVAAMRIVDQAYRATETSAARRVDD